MAPAAGKKPTPWREDAAVLARLTLVSTMFLQGAKPYQIAESMGYSLRTAWRDIGRVKEVMREEARGAIDENRDRSISQMREVQLRAWELYRTSDDKKTKLAALKEVRETEIEITALQGTRRPAGVDLTSKGERITFTANELTDDELAAIAAGEKPGANGKSRSSSG